MIKLGIDINRITSRLDEINNIWIRLCQLEESFFMCKKSDCNCKPLDIEVGQYWKTKGGDKVKILSVEAEGDRPIIGQHMISRLIFSWPLDGNCYPLSDKSLILVEEWKEPVKKVVYLHLVQNSKDPRFTYIFTYGEQRSEIPGYKILSVKKVEMVEGQSDIG